MKIIRTDKATLESKKSLSISKRRPDMCITVMKGSNWKNNRGFGEAKSSNENSNYFGLCKDLLRIGIFSKNGIDIFNMTSILGIQVVGKSSYPF